MRNDELEIMDLKNYLAGKGVEQNYDMAAEMLDFAHHWSKCNMKCTMSN